MKKYVFIGILILLFTPIIPYENEIRHGVTIVENRSVAEWVWKRYQKVQSRQLERSDNVENQSDEKP